MTAAKLLLGLAPAVLVITMCVVVEIHDRLTGRNPQLEAAIARHPSMHGRRASYRTDCGKTVTGTDPWDLVARHMSHELTCLECLAQEETAA